jgi:prolyl 4-hydroxylase
MLMRSISTKARYMVWAALLVVVVSVIVIMITSVALRRKACYDFGSAFDIATWTDNGSTPTQTQLHVPYNVLTLPGVFKKDECDHVIRVMQHKLAQSQVVGVGTNTVSKDRESQSGWVKHTDTELGTFVRKFMSLGSMLTGVRDISRFEDVSIIRYEAGGFYNEHYDACTTKTHCGDNLRLYRLATLILYLNDNFEGGETRFPRINQQVTPQAGKVAFFYNVNSDGAEIKDSLHAGLPVKAGAKWICTLWIRFDPTDAEKSALDAK